MAQLLSLAAAAALTIFVGVLIGALVVYVVLEGPSLAAVVAP